MSRAAAFILAGMLLSPGAEAEDSRIRILTPHPGVFSVAQEDLAGIGFPSTVESESLHLSQGGQSVPILLEDGGDGRFGSGDRLIFVAQHLKGGSAFHHEHSRHNVYWLEAAPGQWPRFRVQEAQSQIPRGSVQLVRRLHRERDELLIRLGQVQTGDEPPPESWYWAKLTHLARRPFKVEISLPDLDPTVPAGITLRIAFRGLTQPAAETQKDLPHHRVDVTLNGKPLSHAEWNGKDQKTLELESLAPGLFEAGSNTLQLKVPPRRAEPDADLLVDVVMVNWVEIEYPYRPTAVDGQLRIHVKAAEDDNRVHWPESSESELQAFGSSGQIYVAGGQTLGPFEPEEELDLVSTRSYFQPSSLELDKASNLKSPESQADYLMVAHARLLDAARPLAELRRGQGLSVALLDVQDVYDEFSHGITDPRAIRDFVAYAYHHWRKPAPEFVLLVGDASWDTREGSIDDADYANWSGRALLAGGQRFASKEYEAYPRGQEVRHRNLIPTYQYQTREGHSASDNFFVAVAGDDHQPDLAIGRLPFVEPHEVAAYVDKLATYRIQETSEDWHRRTLWITNESKGFQRWSDRIAQSVEKQGFLSTKIYPQSSETTNDRHQEALLEAFDQGQLLVHFVGHGGRFIWRTGPPDLAKNHDLFTLEHLDLLEPNHRLPLVLSMTCFSAPFDHPEADSIGEKLLRLPDSGAIAVLAASWRNSPTYSFSQRLVEELLLARQPVGRAILLAKRDMANRTLVETYNLFGDPALDLALPPPVLLSTTVDSDTRNSAESSHHP